MCLSCKAGTLSTELNPIAPNAQTPETANRVNTESRQVYTPQNPKSAEPKPLVFKVSDRIEPATFPKPYSIFLGGTIIPLNPKPYIPYIQGL